MKRIQVMLKKKDVDKMMGGLIKMMGRDEDMQWDKEGFTIPAPIPIRHEATVVGAKNNNG